MADAPRSFNSFLIPGDQTKKTQKIKRSDGGVPTLQMKHLCMLIFGIVSPSSINKLYILHIVGYNKKLYNLISVRQKMFHCSLHVLVVFDFS